jgi:putative tryptophan/tyrosine transport system substrate-binding protein
MRRREFMAGLGSAAAWPAVARTQQRQKPLIGYLSGQAPTAAVAARELVAFRQGLGEVGFVEGQNVVIEYRWAEAQYDRLPALAAELVSRPVAVIVASGSDFAVSAAKAATKSVPIVFSTGGDPVVGGLVASLSRPGGNFTGVTNLNHELSQKKLELMHALVPAATEVALLLNPNNLYAAAQLEETQAAAGVLGVQLHVLRASTQREIESVVANWGRIHAGPLVIGTDGYFSSLGHEIGALALRHGVPAISGSEEFAAAGGLMSYGNAHAEMARLTGIYAGRILNGDKAADLPVQQATKIELIINLQTAKALGLTIPETLLARADKVIE